MKPLALLLALTLAGSPAPPVQPTPDQAKSALAVLAEAPDEGLPPRAADDLPTALASPDPSERAAAALRFQALVLAHARDEYGLVTPLAIDRDWGMSAAPPDLTSAYQQALESGRVTEWLAAQRPADARYRELMGLRRVYAAFVSAGGWKPLGGQVRATHSGPPVAALRERLAAEGYDATPPTGAPTGRFDEGLAAAVSLFRQRHGLEPGADVDARTLAELNVRAEARLAQIDANLERWRWAPRGLPSRRIEINIAAAALRFTEPGAPDLVMRVIVGDPKHHTPLFSSRITGLVLNPPWVVPPSIAARELLPTEKRHPGYLASNRFSWIDGNLVQAPGPRSALAFLKFDMDSPYGVYLHDTPARGLFNNPRRFYSHGCIRLAAPRDLALRLLPDRTAASLAAEIDAGRTRRIAIPDGPPVFVFYWTVGRGEDGAAWFLPDVYGWDAKLAAHASRSTSDAAAGYSG